MCRCTCEQGARCEQRVNIHFMRAAENLGIRDVGHKPQWFVERVIEAVEDGRLDVYGGSHQEARDLITGTSPWSFPVCDSDGGGCDVRDLE